MLSPERQALLVLVHLRRNDTFAHLAAAFGIGAANAHRYVTEVIALPADRAPDLREAMRIAQRKAFVILDGTLAPIDRLSTRHQLPVDAVPQSVSRRAEHHLGGGRGPSKSSQRTTEVPSCPDTTRWVASSRIPLRCQSPESVETGYATLAPV